MEAKVKTSNHALGYLSGMHFRVKRKLHNRKYALFTGGTITV